MTRKILWLLLLLCPLAAAAQDVIVKTNGNTVLCRIVEVSQSEVVYKRWTDLQGNNYVMETTDIAAINYEDGRKLTFGNAATPLTTTSPARPVDDATLLAMASGTDNARKARRLKRGGLIGGSMMAAAGIILIAVAPYEEWYNSYNSWTEWNVPMAACGAVLTGGAIATTTICLTRAKRLQRRELLTVGSAPLLQNEFTLRNGTRLTPSLNALTASHTRSQAIGLGLTYNF